MYVTQLLSEHNSLGFTRIRLEMYLDKVTICLDRSPGVGRFWRLKETLCYNPRYRHTVVPTFFNAFESRKTLYGCIVIVSGKSADIKAEEHSCFGRQKCRY